MTRHWRRVNLEKKLAKRAAARLATEKTKGLDELCHRPPRVQGRRYSVSIAVPGSILKNAQSRELETYLVGEIGRAATVFNVDEIVVFDDAGTTRTDVDDKSEVERLELSENRTACLRMARILQYLECPQYLRRQLFPIHKDLEFAGLLNPLDSTHHLREGDWCEYREGVVTGKPPKKGRGSMIAVGLRTEVYVEKELMRNLRVTLKFNSECTLESRRLSGTLVAPNVPRTEGGLYWGYTVRVAHSIGSVFAESPYDGGYDVTVGTSDKGTSVDDDDFCLPQFRHLLVVFGGLSGLEASVEADETLEVDDAKYMFHHYLNTCPDQGSRTIRTEEAVVITLATLRPKIRKAHAVVG